MRALQRIKRREKLGEFGKAAGIFVGAAGVIAGLTYFMYQSTRPGLAHECATGSRRAEVVREFDGFPTTLSENGKVVGYTKGRYNLPLSVGWAERFCETGRKDTKNLRPSDARGSFIIAQP